MGDWNHDGVADGADLAKLRQAVQNGTADFAQQTVGDTNGDGVLNGADVQLLQQYLLGRRSPWQQYGCRRTRWFRRL